jgi:hypothetical protein
MMPNEGLEEFKRVAADFTDIGALGLKLAAAAPFIDLALKFGPPPAATVSALTCVAELLALLWSFQFWYALDRPAQNRRMRIALLCFCVGLIASIAMIEMLTVSPAFGRERIVEGLVLQPSVKPLIGPSFSAQDALRAAQYDASEVWLQPSIIAVHVCLVSLWCITFASLASYIALFVIMQRTRQTG